MKNYSIIGMSLFFVLIMFSGCSLVSLQMADFVNRELYELTTDDPDKETSTAMADLNLRYSREGNEITLEWDPFPGELAKGYRPVYSATSPWENLNAHPSQFDKDADTITFVPTISGVEKIYVRLLFKVEQTFWGTPMDDKLHLSEAVEVTFK